MHEVLVTVGICTFNRSDSLQKYILPSLRQLSYPNFEVIIIDDFSTDETPKVLSEYNDILNNFRVLRNGKNRGLCYSRNRILKESKGEIIVFADDDVSLFSNCLDEFVSLYLENPETMFSWGCVYQCHGSHERNKKTFCTGSLFSVRKVVGEHFQFDTNIRYFKTFGCEEHDFARRLQKASVQLVKAEAAKANHYHSPAKNRAWRGLGGDLNYLYEKTKKGSILKYYKSLSIGIAYAIQKLIKSGPIDVDFYKYYKEAVYAFHHILCLARDGRIIVSGQYLFFTILDIPIRAWAQRDREEKQADGFINAVSSPN